MLVYAIRELTKDASQIRGGQYQHPASVVHLYFCKLSDSIHRHTQAILEQIVRMTHMHYIANITCAD